MRLWTKGIIMKHWRLKCAASVIGIALALSPVIVNATENDPTQPDPVTNEQLLELYHNSGIWNLDHFKQSNGTYRIGEPQAGGKSAGAVPAGLGQYYSQQMVEHYNSDYIINNELVQDFWLTVPIDYSNPSLGNIALSVTIAGNPNTSKGYIVVNPGGPGGSARNYAINLRYEGSKQGQYAGFLRDYTVVGFTPRGVNPSVPFAQCDPDPYGHNDPTDFSQSISTLTQDNVNKTKKYVNACFSYTGQLFGFTNQQKQAFMRNIGTATAVKDLDILRSVLGQEKLDYLGASYGTRLGYEYARQFPNNVGKFILDGAINPNEEVAPTPQELVSNPSDAILRKQNAHYLDQGQGFQDTFEQFAQWCHNQGNCPLDDARIQPQAGDLADDNSQLSLDTRRVQNILRPLLKNPLVIDDPSAWGGTGKKFYLDFFDATMAVRGGLYFQNNWNNLKTGLQQIIDKDEGHYKLYSFYQLKYNYAKADRSSYNSISCADSANTAYQNPDIGRRVDLMWYAVSPFNDPGYPYNQIGSVAPCNAWPFNGTLPAAQQLTNMPNILVTSVTHDPATPYENGEVLARLVQGTELTVDGSYHVGLYSDSTCLPQVYDDFLHRGTVPADGWRNGVCSIRSFRPKTEPTQPQKPVKVQMTWVVRDEDIAVGASPSDGQFANGKYEYLWMSYHVDSKKWTTISNWSKSNWSSWAQDKGTYWLHLEMRDAKTKKVLDTQTIAFAHTPGKYVINGTYAGTQPNHTVLLGVTSTNPKGKTVTKIYDTQLKTWVAQFPGRWGVWKPKKGIYWTHFELYTSTGKLQDVKTYAFEMK